MYHISIIYASVSGLLAHFHIFVNITLLAMGVLTSLQDLNFIYFHNYPDYLRVWRTELEGVSFCSPCLPCLVACFCIAYAIFLFQSVLFSVKDVTVQHGAKLIVIFIVS